MAIHENIKTTPTVLTLLSTPHHSWIKSRIEKAERDNTSQPPSPQVARKSPFLGARAASSEQSKLRLPEQTHSPKLVHTHFSRDSGLCPSVSSSTKQSWEGEGEEEGEDRRAEGSDSYYSSDSEYDDISDTGAYVNTTLGSQLSLPGNPPRSSASVSPLPLFGGLHPSMSNELLSVDPNSSSSPDLEPVPPPDLASQDLTPTQPPEYAPTEETDKRSEAFAPLCRRGSSQAEVAHDATTDKSQEEQEPEISTVQARIAALTRQQSLSSTDSATSPNSASEAVTFTSPPPIRTVPIKQSSVGHIPNQWKIVQKEDSSPEINASPKTGRQAPPPPPIRTTPIKQFSVGDNPDQLRIVHKEDSSPEINASPNSGRKAPPPPPTRTTPIKQFSVGDNPDQARIVQKEDNSPEVKVIPNSAGGALTSPPPPPTRTTPIKQSSVGDTPYQNVVQQENSSPSETKRLPASNTEEGKQRRLDRIKQDVYERRRQREKQQEAEKQPTEPENSPVPRLEVCELPRVEVCELPPPLPPKPGEPPPPQSVETVTSPPTPPPTVLPKPRPLSATTRLAVQLPPESALQAFKSISMEKSLDSILSDDEAPPIPDHTPDMLLEAMWGAGVPRSTSTPNLSEAPVGAESAQKQEEPAPRRKAWYEGVTLRNMTKKLKIGEKSSQSGKKQQGKGANKPSPTHKGATKADSKAVDGRPQQKANSPAPKHTPPCDSPVDYKPVGVVRARPAEFLVMSRRPLPPEPFPQSGNSPPEHDPTEYDEITFEQQKGRDAKVVRAAGWHPPSAIPQQIPVPPRRQSLRAESVSSSDSEDSNGYEKTDVPVSAPVGPRPLPRVPLQSPEDNLDYDYPDMRRTAFTVGKREVKMPTRPGLRQAPKNANQDSLARTFSASSDYVPMASLDDSYVNWETIADIQSLGTSRGSKTLPRRQPYSLDDMATPYVNFSHPQHHLPSRKRSETQPVPTHTASVSPVPPKPKPKPRKRRSSATTERSDRRSHHKEEWSLQSPTLSHSKTRQTGSETGVSASSLPSKSFMSTLGDGQLPEEGELPEGNAPDIDKMQAALPPRNIRRVKKPTAPYYLNLIM